MHRQGHVSFSLKTRDLEHLPEYLMNYYNSGVIRTNKTIKKPYSCPKGKKKCKLCKGCLENRPSRQNNKHKLIKDSIN